MTEHVDSPSQITDVLQGVQVVADFLASDEVLGKVVQFVARRSMIAFPDLSITGSIADFQYALRFPTARPVLVTSVSIGAESTVRIGHTTFVANSPITLHPLAILRSGDTVQVAGSNTVPLGSVLVSGLEV
jgi:hypothetical protein